MRQGQDFALFAGDNPPVTFALTREADGTPLDLALLSDLEWGMSPMPGAGIGDPGAVVTKKLSQGGIAVEDAPGAEVRLLLTTADTERPPGAYAHQLRAVFAAGYRDTLAGGTVTIMHSPL